MIKVTCWAALISPLIHVGLISTPIDFEYSEELAKGLSIVQVRAPSGQAFVFDASTGALLGHDVGRVLNDHRDLLGEDPEKGLAKIQERRNILMKMRHDAEMMPVDRWTFFRMLHAA